MKTTINRGELAEFVDQFEFKGQYTFTYAELENKLKKTEAAITQALNRLQKKGRIISPRRGFYVIVPAEYRLANGPPPIWYIDKLMKYLDVDYYVGLLSAAEIHGAAHQRPQLFQVMSESAFRNITVASQKINIYRKWNLDETPVTTVKTVTGYVKVSTPEATAFDLVRYFKDAGYLNNVLTVLGELSESIAVSQLVAAGKKGVETSVIQRLGYMFDLLGKDKLANGLEKLLADKEPRIINLRPDMDAHGSELSRRWMLYVNEQLEQDL